MNQCRFQRARSPEQKALRRAQILDAAAGYFSRQRFETISLVDIARQAGVTKAALYRYYPSKEALFLALYLGELEDMVAVPLPEGQAGPMWERLSELLLSRPLFCRLTAILHSVLEQNLDADQARRFKASLLQHFTILAQRLSDHFGLPVDKAGTYLLQVQQALIGCWALSHPAPVVADVIKQPPLNLFQVDFRLALQAHLKALEDAL